MEEILWSLKQQSRLLQEFRQDIQGIWDDQAARDLNSRYLNPHEEDAQEMAKAFQEQNEALEKAKEAVRLSEEQVLVANELTLKVMESLQYVEQELNSAYRTYDQYIHYHVEARNQIPFVQQFINRANSAC